MSTLPFLLSVADELDNLNSQTYMDDFGLGFHPHRHYYRNPNPSIQLSLPASTDWIEEKQRCRSHKFVDDHEHDDDDDESQNNCDDQGNNDDADENTTNHTSNRNSFTNSNDQDNIDNTVHMYNLTKKCRKYNHHGASTSQDITTPSSSSSSFSAVAAAAIHPKNRNQNANPQKCKPTKSLSCPSSSDESLQKTSLTLSSLASIEFLTCFPVKKNKTPKCSSTNKKS